MIFAQGVSDLGVYIPYRKTRIYIPDLLPLVISFPEPELDAPRVKINEPGQLLPIEVRGI